MFYISARKLNFRPLLNFLLNFQSVLTFLKERRIIDLNITKYKQYLYKDSQMSAMLND